MLLARRAHSHSRSLSSYGSDGKKYDPFIGVSSCEERERAQIIVKRHPLKNSIVDNVRASWECVKEKRSMINPYMFPYENDTRAAHTETFLNHLDFFIDTGAQEGRWTRGNAMRSERDMVCSMQPVFSFNVILSGEYQGDSVVLFLRKREQKPQRKQRNGRKRYVLPDGYQLIVACDFETMALHSVRFGWLQRSDWVQLVGAPSIAVVDEKIARRKLVTLYGDNGE